LDFTLYYRLKHGGMNLLQAWVKASKQARPEFFRPRLLSGQP